MNFWEQCDLFCKSVWEIMNGIVLDGVIQIAILLVVGVVVLWVCYELGNVAKIALN